MVVPRKGFLNECSRKSSNPVLYPTKDVLVFNMRQTEEIYLDYYGPGGPGGGGYCHIWAI